MAGQASLIISLTTRPMPITNFDVVRPCAADLELEFFLVKLPSTSACIRQSEN